MPWRCKDERLKMGFARMLKHLRILRDILKDHRNQVYKPRKVIFQARNCVETKKMQKEEVVNSNNGGRRESEEKEVKKKKK